MLSGKYKDLYEILVKRINKSRIFHDPLHTLAYGTDASFYRLIPKMVVKAANEEEVSFILKKCSSYGIPVTFRAAGTSLSGQAVTDSVLLIAGDDWKKYSIGEDAQEITLQPGITGGRANSLLSGYGRKIGPDPASLNAAMIGGIAANNASGMCCGVSQNSYKTVNGIRVVFADGSILDTGDKNSVESFRNTNPDMLDQLSLLAISAKKNEALAERIRRKYKMKNTTGYSLNALVDFSDPVEILEHLMIGSEGTLGFISEITYRTVVNEPCRASSLMIFPNIATACKAVIILKTTPVSAVELIDRTGLRSVEMQEGMPAYLSSLDDKACALLVETTGSDPDELITKTDQICAVLADTRTVQGVQFTSVQNEYEKLWKIRKGLFPSVGAMRKSGTTVIIEDVAFPVHKLAEATLDLRSALDNNGYRQAVIFGHALEGNLHFVFNQDFSTPEEVDKYSKLMSAVADLVVNKYDGSLKAEHGTGRNIAPFVEMEWGKEAYSLMKEIKNIFDPGNILNPGVILNDDSQAHLKDLKPPRISSEITDKCTECGFCEPSCVSAGLTLTPRQRIVVHREMAWLKSTGLQPHIAASMAQSYKYEGDQTCATDGLCALECPVKIDCGTLIKSIRKENAEGHTGATDYISGNMKRVTSLARGSLKAVSFFHKIFGAAMTSAIASALRKVSANRIPAWNPYMPSGASKIRTDKNIQAVSSLKVVYFPSCINRSFGVSREYRDEKQVTDTMVKLLEKAGYRIIWPDNMDNLCCGMAFMSKGYVDAGRKKSDELEAALMKASNNGEYPVLCEMSPCLFTMRENLNPALRLFEPVEFSLEYLVPHLHIKQSEETVTVFPVCSMKKMGLDKKLTELAGLCAGKVVVADANCCGFAGDRGFTFPELNRHGLRNLKKQIPEHCTEGYSNSRTCEIGLSLHSGISFKSIVYLLEKVSAPKEKEV